MKAKTTKRRLLSGLLCLCMILSMFSGMTAFAEEEKEYEVGLCEHHSTHTAECGYVEAVEGQLCTHEHGEDCGYIKDDADSCSHIHDEECGYVEAVEGHACEFVCRICDAMVDELNLSRDSYQNKNDAISPMSIKPDGDTYVQIRFYERDMDTEISEYRQIVKLGDKLNEPGTDRLNLADNEIFMGWQYNASEYLLPGHVITQEDIDAAQNIEGVEETTLVLKVYPDIALLHYVYFHDDYDSIYATQKAVPTGNVNECLVDSSDWPTPNLTLGNFVAWVDIDLFGNTLSGDESMTLEDFRAKVLQDPGFLTAHTVTASTNFHELAAKQSDGVNDYNVDVWAYYDDQFWVTFNTLGGGFVESLRLDPGYQIDLSDIESILYNQTDNHNYQADYTYIQPSKMGYKFDGWSTEVNSDGTGGEPTKKVTGEYTVTAGTTFYAIWEPDYVTYTITYLGEAPDISDSAREAVDLSGTDYDTVVLKSVSRTALTGSTVQAIDAESLSSDTNADCYFEDLRFYDRDDLRNSNLSVVIEPDGSSVLYVYYTLQIFDVGFDIYPYYYSAENNKTVANFAETPSFTLNGKTYTGVSDKSENDITTEYSIKIKLGQNIVALWPMADDFENNGQFKSDNNKDYFFRGWTRSVNEYNPEATVQNTRIIYASREVIDGAPHISDWTTDVYLYSFAYYFESVDQRTGIEDDDSEVYHQRVLGYTEDPSMEYYNTGSPVTKHRGTDGVYYDEALEYSYPRYYNMQHIWGHKVIEGFGIWIEDISDDGTYPKGAGYVATEEYKGDDGYDYRVEFYYDRTSYALHLVNPGQEEPEVHSIKHGFDMTNYFYDSGANYLTEPERPAEYDENWRFIGWYRERPEDVVYDPRNPEGNTTSYYDATSDEPCAMPMNNLTLYAYWYRPTINYEFVIKVDNVEQVFKGTAPEGTKFSTISDYEDAKRTAENYVKGQPDKSIEFRGFYYMDENGYADTDSRLFNPDIEMYDDVYVRAVFAEAEAYSLTYLPGPFMETPDGFEEYITSSKNYTPNEGSGPRLLTYEQVVADSNNAYKPNEKCYEDGVQKWFFGYWVESDKDGNILPELLNEDGTLKAEAMKYYPGDMIAITKDTYVIPYFVNPLKPVMIAYHWVLDDSFIEFLGDDNGLNHGLNFVYALYPASQTEYGDALFKGYIIPMGYQFWGWSTTPVGIVETDSLLDNADVTNYPGEDIKIFSPGDAVRYSDEVLDDLDDSTEDSPNHFYAVWTKVKEPSEALGGLTISKTVTGSGSSKDDTKFKFVIQVDHKAVNGVWTDSGIRFNEGRAEIALRNGESVTIKGLPAGIIYTVTETEANRNGYTTTATGDTGIIPVNDIATAAFVNNKNDTPINPTDPTDPTDPTEPSGPSHPDKPGHPSGPSTPGTPSSPTPPDNTGRIDSVPKTGDDTNIALWVSIMLMSSAALIVLLRKTRKGKSISK